MYPVCRKLLEGLLCARYNSHVSSLNLDLSMKIYKCGLFSQSQSSMNTSKENKSQTRLPSKLIYASLQDICFKNLFYRYYKTNEVQRFTYDRPFHKGKKNKDCEFAVSGMSRQ